MVVFFSQMRCGFVTEGKGTGNGGTVVIQTSASTCGILDDESNHSLDSCGPDLNSKGRLVVSELWELSLPGMLLLSSSWCNDKSALVPFYVLCAYIGSSSSRKAVILKNK